MAEDTIIWRGASGQVYKYWIYALPHSFRDGEEGNYIYCKKSANMWNAVYIGEGDLGDRIGPNHHKATCIKYKGATHVHAHKNTDEDARISEEQDLLKEHTEAYAPSGCNEKEGG